MNKKTLALGLCMLLLTIVTSVSITLFGTYLLNRDKEGSSSFSQFFSSTKEHSLAFVELKNVVLTLQSHSTHERYLLLELALVTNDPENIERIKDIAPALRGATVSLLSDMEYTVVRAMNVGTLREQLMKAYRERLESLGSEIPFNDVIISKMIFQ